MTGLDLESFLHLIQADLSTWAFLGLATLGLALVAWSCRGSRRVLRKCIVLSLAAHVGLVFYGSTMPAVLWAVNPDRRDAKSRPIYERFGSRLFSSRHRHRGRDRGTEGRDPAADRAGR